MKKILLLLFILTFSLLSIGQTVLVKDSTVNSAGIPYGASDVTIYSYNSNCQVVYQKSSMPLRQAFYSYYPNGSLYQYSTQNYTFTNADQTTGFWGDTSRATYTYNGSGKLVNEIDQLRNENLGSYVNTYKDSNVYDGNNFLIRNYHQKWDTTLNIWITQDSSNYYNNANGQPDSIIYFYDFQFHKINKAYTTYYSSGKVYQQSTYAYSDSGVSLSGGYHKTYYYDSSAYVSKDSVVTIGISSDSTLSGLLSDIHTDVKYYNTDNYLIEKDYLTIFTNLLESINTKTYYSYGPCSSALPVTLVSFSGVRQKNDVRLQWQTANENSIAAFVVERSTDGTQFEKIGNIPVGANGSAEWSYNFTDRNAYLLNTKTLYYRLAATDKNGVTTYSKILTLDVTTKRPLVYVSPNPASGFINVYATTALGNALLTLTDMHGRVIYTANKNMGAGEHVAINAALLNGMYIVSVQTINAKQIIKVMIAGR